MPSRPIESAEWTFLTNHGHVLLALAEDPEVTVETVARRVGITERSARRIIAELTGAGYVTKERVGRNNRYRLHPERPLRHPVEKQRPVSELIALVRRR
jgi:DNA-binding transcriptional ArsR family regulator